MATSPSAYFPHLILPKGQQIKDGLYCILRDAILEGRLSAGTKLPSSRTLAEMMLISRNSVLAALERLLDEGYLVTKPSSGTYVADIIPDQLIQIQKDIPPAVHQSTQTLNIHPHIASLLPHWHKQTLSSQESVKRYRRYFCIH